MQGEFREVYGAGYNSGDLVYGTPGAEYHHVFQFIATYISAFRMAMGDTDFGGTTILDSKNNYLSWVIWFLIVVVSGLIFLNFLIAKASNTYIKIDENLDSYIECDKISLIDEA